MISRRGSFVVGHWPLWSRGMSQPMSFVFGQRPRTNDQRRSPNPVQLSVSRSPVTYVQKYRDFELALFAARAVPSCCSHGHAPWLAFCAR